MKGKNGFTFIEVILSLLLMGIMSAIWGLGIVQIVEGFVFSRQSIENLQKGQIAMARLVKEFQHAASISADPLPNQSSITFSRDTDDPGVYRTISFDSSNGLLKIDDDTLTDTVGAFRLAYYDRHDAPSPLTIEAADGISDISIIEIVFELKGPGNTVSELKNRVFLRELIR